MAWLWVLPAVLVLLVIAFMVFAAMVLYGFLVVCAEATARQDKGSVRSDRERWRPEPIESPRQEL